MRVVVHAHHAWPLAHRTALVDIGAFGTLPGHYSYEWTDKIWGFYGLTGMRHVRAE
jgi:hypothetical protein